MSKGNGKQAEKRLLIAIPMLTEGVSYYLASLMCAVTAGKVDSYGAKVDVSFIDNLKPRDWMRNRVVEDLMFGLKATHILFIDSDVIPPKNVLRLIEHDKDICGGLYLQWQDYMARPMAFKAHHIDDPDLTDADKPYLEELRRQNMKYVWKHLRRLPSGTLMKVDALATGCLMIKREVFEKLERPWFRNLYDKDGQEIMTEDIYFAEKAMDAGFETWLDTDIVCSHYKRLNMTTVHTGMQMYASDILKEHVDQAGCSIEEEKPRIIVGG